jgi:hypothetical protein
MIPATNRFLAALQGVASSDIAACGEQALEFAESLLANDGFASIEAARLVAAKGGCQRAAVPLVRAIPCGLFYFRDHGSLRETAEKACRLTHSEPADVAASVAMALAVARLLETEEFLPQRFLRELADSVRGISQGAYARIHGLIYPLRKELPFLCTSLSEPLEIFRAALYLFLSCQACDLQTESDRHDLTETPVLPLAYTLAGSRGTFCRLEKPSLRAIMIAEAFHKAAAETDTTPAD